jgi:ABC-type arginine/histidine transport system permease subunit
MRAARSLGMSYALAMRRIILPQALRRVLPPIANEALPHFPAPCAANVCRRPMIVHRAE